MNWTTHNVEVLNNVDYLLACMINTMYILASRILLNHNCCQHQMPLDCGPYVTVSIVTKIYNFIKKMLSMGTCQGSSAELISMMTSSNGNIFRVAGHLCRDSPVTGEFPAQKLVKQSFMFSLICAWINGWVNNDEDVDLRRHRAHYDVTVMPWSR